MDTLRLWRVFNLDHAELEELHRKQDGKCGVCQRPVILGTPGTNTDHDHKTGLVRGLLCHICNRALGLFADSPDLLRAALAFLHDPPATRALGAPRFGRLGRSTNKVGKHKRKDLKPRTATCAGTPTAVYLCGCKDYGVHPLKACPVHKQISV